MHYYFGLSLGFGDIYADRGTGLLITPFDGSVQRMLAIGKYIKEHRGNDGVGMLVSCAGYSKKDPLHPQPERAVTLAEQANRFWREDQKAFRTIPHLAYPCCWSTENEVMMGLKVMRLQVTNGESSRVTVVIASHELHLKRIKMYTDKYLPKGWTVVLLPVEHQFSWIDKLGEWVKMTRDLVMLRLKRINSALPDGEIALAK